MNNIDIDEIVNGLFKETHVDLDTPILITNWDYRKMKIVSNGVCIDDQIAELYEKFPYGNAIQDWLEILGDEGKFSVFLDNSTNQHEISEHTLSLILDEMS